MASQLRIRPEGSQALLQAERRQSAMECFQMLRCWQACPSAPDRRLMVRQAACPQEPARGSERGRVSDLEPGG